MTNKLAIVLALLVVAFFVTDAFAFDGAMGVFLGQKFFVFLDWLAFWR